MGDFDLSDSDVQAMLNVVSRSAAADPGPALPWELLHDLRDLIACDSLTVSGQDDQRLTHFANQELADDVPAGVDLADEVGADDVYWLHYEDSLACSYPSQSRDLVSVTMESDFYSVRAWHDTGMYVDYLRPNGIEHELMVCLPAGPGRTLRVLFFRGTGAAFTERDRALLTLLRPHLLSAYLAAERRRLGQVTLTPRQHEVLQHVAAGLSNGQIARRLSVSEATVRKHLENVFVRLNVTSRTAAIGRAGIEPFHG